MALIICTAVTMLIIYFVMRQTNKSQPPTKPTPQNRTRTYQPRPKQVKQNNNSEYQQIIKPTSSKDNMNCDLYVFSGKFSETKRMRKNHTIHAFGNEFVKDAIINLGYEEPIEFEKIDFREPTEAQASYLYDLANGIVPSNVSLDDASALIDRYVEHDSVANPHLFKYATEMHIPVSYYCGKKLLYNLIFSGLELRDQIAFFIFQVYRDSYDAHGSHEIANLNNSPYKSLFYDFADQYLDDESFIKSMQKYSGKDLRFFGNRSFYGHQRTGGSKNTIAYKTAKAYLNSRTEYA